MISYKELGLVNSKELFAKAVKGGYAIPAFNFNNMEQMQAIIMACVETKSPVILQVSSGARKYANQTLLRYMAQGAVEYAKELGANIPIVLHLDHGDTFELCKSCIDMGFSSVMIDGSHFSFDQNIELTKQAAEIAHAKNVPIEGEIGELLEDKSKMADPIEAKEFVTQTGIDFLAPSVGTSHGLNANEKVDLELLQRIKEQVNIPLVLHGASGVGEDDVRKAIKLGISKINIHTELRLAFIDGMKEGLAQNPNTDDHRVILKVCIEKMQHVVEEKIDLFGSSGKL